MVEKKGGTSEIKHLDRVFRQGCFIQIEHVRIFDTVDSLVCLSSKFLDMSYAFLTFF